jgi:hypothetical protein
VFVSRELAVLLILSVFYICLFDVRLPEDDLKKIETCWKISGQYVKVYILILVCLLVLSVKLTCSVLAAIIIFLYFCQLILNWQQALYRS